MGRRAREEKQDADELKRLLDKAIAELTPEQAAEFERHMARANKRRAILLSGYLLSLVALLGGMVLVLYVYATAEPGSFRAWTFLVPVAAMGLIFTATGRIARRYES